MNTRLAFSLMGLITDENFETQNDCLETVKLFTQKYDWGNVLIFAIIDDEQLQKLRQKLNYRNFHLLTYFKSENLIQCNGVHDILNKCDQYDIDYIIDTEYVTPKYWDIFTEKVCLVKFGPLPKPLSIRHPKVRYIKNFKKLRAWSCKIPAQR